MHKQSYAAAVQPLASTNLEAAAIHPTTNWAQTPSPDALRNAVINEKKEKQNLIVRNMTAQTQKEQDTANFQDILTSQLDV